MLNKSRIIFGVILVLSLSRLCAYADTEGVIIIANYSIGNDEISVRELRDVFLGNRGQIMGVSIQPVILNDPKIHDLFLHAYIGRQSAQFLMHWRNVVFTGRGRFPRSFENIEEVVEYVRRTEGAIGYISGPLPENGYKVLVIN